ncbi:MAG: RNA polymerase sigma factor [Phycisphaerae bacterium]
MGRPVPLEDVELIEQVKAGKTECYGRLVEKYQDRVFNVCWRICGHLEDARDVTQEAFLKALDGISAFRQHSGFYTWVFRVAVNLALSQRRKAKIRQTTSLDATVDPFGSQAEALARRVQDDSSEDPSGAAARAELHGRMALALQELHDDYRAVVVLRDIEGLDYSEISEVLQIPVGTVRSRLYRGRMALRETVMPAAKKPQG